jgi:hypothetical protein
MARKNAVVSVEVTDTMINFVVADTGVVHMPFTKLPDDVVRAAMLHGLIQKISDAAALPKNEDGSPASPADKMAAMAAVADRLCEGSWNKRGEASGETAPSGLIRRAFVAWCVGEKKTEASANAYYNKLDRAGQLALRKIPGVADAMERIKAERGTPATVDADALLAEIG